MSYEKKLSETLEKLNDIANNLAAIHGHDFAFTVCTSAQIRVMAAGLLRAMPAAMLFTAIREAAEKGESFNPDDPREEAKIHLNVRMLANSMVELLDRNDTLIAKLHGHGMTPEKAKEVGNAYFGHVIQAAGAIDTGELKGI